MEKADFENIDKTIKILKKFNLFLNSNNNKRNIDMMVVGCCIKDFKRCKEMRKNELINILKYDYNEKNWIYCINLLDQRYKIVTTKKIENILSTTDESLTIKDIAALSTNVKVIIAINTGVVPGLLNIYTLQKIRKFYTFDNREYYSYPNFERKTRLIDITIDELDNYIK